MNTLEKQNGFTLIELLALLAALALLLAGLAGISGSITKQAQRTACLATQAETLQFFDAWFRTVNPDAPNGDRVLCKSAKTATETWNKQCKDVLGTALPVPPKCDD